MLYTPENFKAVGDGIADDADALEDFFNCGESALALMPNKRYAFHRPIRIKPAKYFSHVLYGNRSKLVYKGGKDKGYAVILGEKDVIMGDHVTWNDLTISIDSNGADGGLLIGECNFGVFNSLRVNGVLEEAAIRIHQAIPIQFNSVFLQKARYGIIAGIDDSVGDDTLKSTVNTLGVYGGRIVNCQTGIRYSGTKFTISNLDCSNFIDAAVDLSGAQYGVIDMYTEVRRPYDGIKDSAVVRMHTCNGITVMGMLNASRKIDYCIDAMRCEDIFNFGRGAYPRTAFIRDVECENFCKLATCKTK